ncbi:MAG: FIST C-terminal domain-containing protein [Actinomycetota bacterium]
MNAFASAVSTSADPANAAREACAAVRDGLRGSTADLVVVFATPDLMANAAGIGAIVAAELAPGAVIGCTAEGVAGTGREVEAPPGLAIWAASLPGTALEPFVLDPGLDADGATVLTGWPAQVDPRAPDEIASGDAVILLADPFSFPPESLHDASGKPAARTIIGGMASGEHRLIFGEHVLAEGAVGVVVPGARAVVSQGCRPVGPEMTITACHDGVVEQLAGRPALERVRAVVEDLPPEDRALVDHGVLAGLVEDGNKPQLEQGDFLIRGILGGDPESGAIAVGERVRVGQVMRLQVRDHESADADLRRALADVPGGRAGGALLFTCNGRGTRMFPAPHHDARAVADVLGDIPLAGLFCNGEIGPVGGRAHLHGFTATLAVFPAA